MSVFETFGLLFDTNASKAGKDVKGLSSDLDKYDRSATKAANAGDEVTNSFMGMAKNAIPVLAAIAMVTKAIGTMKASYSDSADLEFDSFTTGTVVDNLDALSRAVEKFGGSGEAVKSTLGGIQGDLDALAAGAKDVGEKYSKVGINLLGDDGQLKSSLEVLKDFEKLSRTISKEAGRGVASDLGIDAGILKALNDSGLSIDELIAKQKILGSATKEDAEAAREVAAAWSEVGDVFDNIIRTLATENADGLVESFENLKEIMYSIEEVFGSIVKGWDEIFKALGLEDGGALQGIVELIREFNMMMNGDSIIVNHLVDQTKGGYSDFVSSTNAVDDKVVETYDDVTTAIGSGFKTVASELFSAMTMGSGIGQFNVQAYEAAQKTKANQPIQALTKPSASSGNNSFNIELNIGSVQGTQADAEKLARMINEAMASSIAIDFNDGIVS